MERSTHLSPSKGGIGAAAGGATGGTAVVLLASYLPDASPYKRPLLVAAPTIAVLSTGLLRFAWHQLRAWLADRRIQDAKKTIGGCLGNPATSDDHKAQMRKKLENLENLAVDTKLQQVERFLDNGEDDSNKSIKTSK